MLMKDTSSCGSHVYKHIRAGWESDASVPALFFNALLFMELRELDSSPGRNPEPDPRACSNSRDLCFTGLMGG